MENATFWSSSSSLLLLEHQLVAISCTQTGKHVYLSRAFPVLLIAKKCRKIRKLAREGVDPRVAWKRDQTDGRVCG